MSDWIAPLQLSELNELTIVVRLVLSALLSGILGFERSQKRRPAGFRTYMLVSVGATLVMITGEYLAKSLGGDAARMGAQVISGIGFIGAGTIMMTGHQQIKGLTTAAGLWAAACMGLAVGAGLYFAAIMTFVLLALIMMLAERLQGKFIARSRRMRVYIILDQFECLHEFLNYVRSHDISVDDFNLTRADTREGIGVTCELGFKEKRAHSQVIEQLSQFEGVAFLEEF